MGTALKHPFLTEAEHGNLIFFAQKLLELGDMKVLDDQGEILLSMAMCNYVPAKDSIIHLFSDEKHCWFVASRADGYAGLKLNRSFMETQAANPAQRHRMFNGLACLCGVDPRTLKLNDAEMFGANRIVTP